MLVDKQENLNEPLTAAELKIVKEIETDVTNLLKNRVMRYFLAGVWGRLSKHFELNDLMLEKGNVAAVSRNVRLLMNHNLDEEGSSDPCLTVAQTINDRMKSKMFQTVASKYIDKFEEMLAADDVNEMRVIDAVIDGMWPVLLKELG